jgi:hypothetical protein
MLRKSRTVGLRPITSVTRLRIARNADIPSSSSSLNLIHILGLEIKVAGFRQQRQPIDLFVELVDDSHSVFRLGTGLGDDGVAIVLTVTLSGSRPRAATASLKLRGSRFGAVRS